MKLFYVIKALANVLSSLQVEIKDEIAAQREEKPLTKVDVMIILKDMLESAIFSLEMDEKLDETENDDSEEDNESDIFDSAHISMIYNDQEFDIDDSLDILTDLKIRGQNGSEYWVADQYVEESHPKATLAVTFYEVELMDGTKLDEIHMIITGKIGGEDNLYFFVESFKIIGEVKNRS